MGHGQAIYTLHQKIIVPGSFFHRMREADAPFITGMRSKGKGLALLRHHCHHQACGIPGYKKQQNTY